MAKPKLPFRLADLNGLPEPFHQLYAPDPRGGFTLQVDGAAEVMAAEDQPPAPGKPKDPADALRDQLLDRAIARIGPKPEHTDALRASLRPCIRVEHVPGEDPQVAFLTPSGFRWPSSMPNTAWCDFDEFILRASDPTLGTPVVKAEWLPDAPPAPKSREQLAREDSEDLPVQPRNIRLPRGYSQRQFEEATALANERGGQVLFPDAPPPAAPTLNYRPGKDVRLSREDLDAPDGQARFEKAYQLAKANGGEIVYPDPVAQEQPTENDMRMGEGIAAMQASQKGAYR